MSLADFTVKTKYDDHPYEVRVIVYKTLAAMRGAATKFNSAQRDSNSDACGVCHRFASGFMDGLNHDPFVAIVRLAEPYLGVGIVSHELAHAATWIRELNDDDPLVCQNDEEFCWTLGDLIRQTVCEFYEHDVW